MKTQHTQGKLAVTLSGQSDYGYKAQIGIVGGETIGYSWLAKSDPETVKANAERLALCWNMHDELVKKLRTMATMYSGREHHDAEYLKTVTDLLDQADGVR